MECGYCGAESKLYYRDIPICMDCSDRIDAHEVLTLCQDSEPEAARTADTPSVR